MHDTVIYNRFSCDRQTLERLSSLAQGIRSMDQKLNNLKDYVFNSQEDNDLSEQTSLMVRSANAFKSRKLEKLKRICLKKHVFIQNIFDQIDENDRNQNKLEAKIEILKERIEQFRIEHEKRQNVLNVYKEVLRVKRRNLIEDLQKVFPVETISPPSKDCACEPYYTIRGIHFPSVPLQQGHKELLLSSALGIIVHFLKTLGDIMDYTFHNPVIHNSSNSSIVHNHYEKLVPLYKAGWRSDKDRLDVAFALLSQNVMQLANDTGYSLSEDNIAASIREWMQSFLKNSKPMDLCRPSQSIFSPASLTEDHFSSLEKGIRDMFTTVPYTNDVIKI